MDELPNHPAKGAFFGMLMVFAVGMIVLGAVGGVVLTVVAGVVLLILAAVPFSLVLRERNPKWMHAPLDRRAAGQPMGPALRAVAPWLAGAGSCGGANGPRRRDRER